MEGWRGEGGRGREGGEDAAASSSPATHPPPRTTHLLALSGKRAEALAELAGRYGEWLGAHPEAELADVCFTAGVGRNHFEYRAGLVVGSHAGAIELCARLGRGRGGAGLATGQARGTPKLAWAFGANGVP